MRCENETRRFLVIVIFSASGHFITHSETLTSRTRPFIADGFYDLSQQESALLVQKGRRSALKEQFDIGGEIHLFAAGRS